MPSLVATFVSAVAMVLTTLGVPATPALSTALTSPQGLSRAAAAAETVPTPSTPSTPSTPKHTKAQAVRQKVQKPARQAARADATNPFVGRPWASYGGPAEMAWDPYVRATGEKKELLAKIALTPKAKWFGNWIPTRDIAGKVREYITNAQKGDPTALVQFTTFRMSPWEHDACKRLPTKAETRDFKAWTDAFAAAVGSTPSAFIIQPDGPFSLCAPGGSKKPSHLIRYSVKKFAALPNAAVYIEAGAADWPHPAQGGVGAALKILIPAGIKHARGVALNGTHYSATPDEVRRGADIVRALDARGITGKRVVINTSSNGHPFPFGTYKGPDPDHAWECTSATDNRTCVMLGIPPTAQVSHPAWGLPAETNALAVQYVDAYLWFGRPWLYRQNSPFMTDRALTLVRNWPYAANWTLR